MTDDTFSDFRIICGFKTFNCHQCIVGGKSDVLQKMFLSGDWAENVDETLKIEDFDAETVRAMIHFIYTAQLPPSFKCSLRL